MARRGNVESARGPKVALVVPRGGNDGCDESQKKRVRITKT